jgi:chromosome segregation ATPase
LNLHRARREKVASREALVEKAEADMQRRAEILTDIRARSLNALEVKQAQLAEERQALLLMKRDIEQQQEETANKLSAQAGDLNQRKVDLDAHEEELAEREKKLAETLQQKDEEVAKLVAERTQG